MSCPEFEAMGKYAGKWVDEGNGDCGYTMTENCLCYTCICFTYQGCPYSGSNAWSCGTGCIMGPCIGLTYKDETMTLRWLCCPAETYKRASPSYGGPPPAGEEMTR